MREWVLQHGIDENVWAVGKRASSIQILALFHAS